MASSLSKLACGSPNSGELAEILTHVGGSIDSLVERLSALVQDTDDEPIKIYGPFIGRSILETCFTALISRFDPFRALYVRECQMQSTYSVGVRANSAIQWQGDIMAPKPPENLWSPDVKLTNVSRALFSNFSNEIYWQKAFVKFLDETEIADGDQWLVELHSLTPGEFIPRMKADASRLFSSLSKGIHHEFVVPPSTLYDRSVVTELIANTLKVVASMASVSHCCDHVPFCLDLAEAVEAFNQVETIEVK